MLCEKHMTQSKCSHETVPTTTITEGSSNSRGTSREGVTVLLGDLRDAYT